MKMKNIIIASFVALFSLSSFAQETDTLQNETDTLQKELSDDCKKNISYMGLYGEQKAWRDAANFFIKAVKFCGPENLDGTDWSNARAIFSSLSKEEGISPERKKEITDSIGWCYDTEVKYYNSPKLSIDYATFLVKNNSEDLAKIDELYGYSVHQLKEKLSVSHIVRYYIHLLNNVNASEDDESRSIATNFAIDEYLKLSDYITIALKKFKGNEKATASYGKAQSYLDKYFIQLSKDCETLTGILIAKTNNLPQNKEDKLNAISGYLKLLELRGCGDSDLYGQLADSSITIAPSAAAYFAQANFYKRKESKSKAMEYYKKAIELEGPEGEEVNKYLYSLAVYQSKQNSHRAAFATAKKVEGEYKGKAMLICAASIGSTAKSCGDTTFDRKANYWLADDYMKKAAALGETYRSGYANGAPSKDETFEAGKKAGERITLSCWGESTTIR